MLLRFRRRPEPLADRLKRHIKGRDHEDTDERREDHASEHWRADVSTGQLRGACRNDQGKEPEDEGEGRHHHRAEALSRTLGRRFEQGHSGFSLLLRELDDQNSVLGCKADQHDDADLRIKIERQPAKQDCDKRSEDSDRDRKQDRHRNCPALIKRDQEQIGEQEREAEDDTGLALGALLLERRIRPLSRIALRQGLRGDFFHRLQSLS